MTTRTHTEDLDPAEPTAANEPLDGAATPTSPIDQPDLPTDEDTDLETETQVLHEYIQHGR